METVTAIFVDYESPLAKEVASAIWSGLSQAALGVGEGRVKNTVLWESVEEVANFEAPEGLDLQMFVLDQGRPDAIDALEGAVEPDSSRLYALVVAIPEQGSPLAGTLLYSAVEKLTGNGVRMGSIEPALLYGLPEECESYAGRLLERLGEAGRKR